MLMTSTPCWKGSSMAPDGIESTKPSGPNGPTEVGEDKWTMQEFAKAESDQVKC